MQEGWIATNVVKMKEQAYQDDFYVLKIFDVNCMCPTNIIYIHSKAPEVVKSGRGKLQTLY